MANSGVRRQGKNLMSGDLLIIVPSRGRPQNIARLLDAVHATRQLATHVHVAVDDDDPELSRYEFVVKKAGIDGDELQVGSRKGLAAWTNDVAVRRAGEYPYLASFGDDHVPRTKGFDRALIRGIEDMGGTGFTYPWDGTREDIPEAVIMSSDIVQALGWMCLPSLNHYYVDNVWADLGRNAGCLRHLRAIAVDHVHPVTGAVPGDATYQASSAKIQADQEAYNEWRSSGQMLDDIKKVISLRERQLLPA
jgi:hypothetical protein